MDNQSRRDPVQLFQAWKLLEGNAMVDLVPIAASELRVVP